MAANTTRITAGSNESYIKQGANQTIHLTSTSSPTTRPPDLPIDKCPRAEQPPSPGSPDTSTFRHRHPYLLLAHGFARRKYTNAAYSSCSATSKIGTFSQRKKAPSAILIARTKSVHAPVTGSLACYFILERTQRSPAIAPPSLQHHTHIIILPIGSKVCHRT